jgi:hypothetical protein
MGFPHGWLQWMSAILSSASTKVLINGTLGDRISHARGLRQGDPLPPMLFLLIMEVLSAVIKKVDAWGLLSELGVRAIPHWTSMCTDDLIMFVKPLAQDMQLLCSIFDSFQGASDLGYNLSKCQMVSIRRLLISQWSSFLLRWSTSRSTI